ncbi:MAG TPA: AraC family transcriptional regulator, partial [Candidatus Ventrisoma faecale]|nr:AraC family transcriptional regulator [Candidatus Ventrisoma faecale]
ARFNNLSHFSRTFKNKVGMSPKQYQQKNIPRDGSE